MAAANAKVLTAIKLRWLTAIVPDVTFTGQCRPPEARPSPPPSCESPFHTNNWTQRFTSAQLCKRNWRGGLVRTRTEGRGTKEGREAKWRERACGGAWGGINVESNEGMWGEKVNTGGSQRSLRARLKAGL